MKNIVFIILVFVVAFACHKWAKRRRLYKSTGSRPSILDGAKCVLNEQNISTEQPVPLHGRVDQVFELSDGRWLPLDTKVRDRIAVYPSDIVQLSVYSIILKYQGHRVCPFGLLRFPVAGKDAIYLPVKLFSEEKIVKLYQRYIALQSGVMVGDCTCGKHDA